MKRREFITLIGSAATWPLAARAGQADMPVVGFVHSSSPEYFGSFNKAFHAGLEQLSYTEGKNVRIEYRWAEGRYERLPALVSDLLSRNVELIFAAGGTDPAKAAEAATTSTPIVFVSAADPVRTGLVASLNHPGGNVTGVSLLASSLGAKKLDLLRAVVPNAATFGALINPDYPEAKAQSDDLQAAAAQLGVGLVLLTARTEADITSVFASLDQQQVKAIVVSNDPYYGARRAQLIALAASHAIPMMYYQREFVVDGGLISYGPQFADGYRQGGVYVGRILNGEKPADLPVVQPTEFEMVINLKTAKALGLNVPATVLATADEVIE